MEGGWSKKGDKVFSSSKGRYPSQLFIDEYCSQVIDEQSGTLKSGDNCVRTKKGEGYHGNMGKAGDVQVFYGDSGGASRINHIVPWTNEEVDLLHYEPKVSPKERNAGLENLKYVKSFSEETNEKRNVDFYSMSYFCKICGKRKDSCKCENPKYEVKERPGRNKLVKNNHPTLKPMFLNFKIFELFTVPDLEDMKVYVPFAGTFSEVIGILANGVKEENIYACELSEDYVEIGKARLEFWKKQGFDFKNLKAKKLQPKKEEEDKLPQLF